MKKLISSALCLCLIFSLFATTAFAADTVTKDETVYVNLNADGSVGGIYVVNAFESETAQNITDLGAYSEVKNLSSKGTLTFDSGKIPLELPEGRFYFQGNMDSTALPWSFKITYLLDGVEITADELAGKSGSLEIKIDVSEGDSEYAVFFDNYMLQISYTLSSDRCTNVVSDSASLVSAGRNINVSFTHMQGKSGSYSLSCNVQNFEMGAINFRAVNRTAMDIDTSPLDDMTAQFEELAEGVSKLSDAADKITSASGTFLTGINDFAANSKEISTASAEIGKAITDIDSTLAGVLTQAEQVKNIAEALLSSDDPQVKMLAKAYLAQTEALTQTVLAIGKLAEGYAAFDKGLQAIPTQAGQMQAGYSQINNGMGELSNGLDTLNENVALIPEQINEKTDTLLSQYIGGEFTPISFSAKDNTIESVTFIMKTGEISIPIQPVAVSEVKEPSTFWEKLLDLFGLFD